MCPSNEFFYLDDNGKKQDAALHEAILNNPEADKALSEMAIKRAIADGMDPEAARRVYGTEPKT